MRLVRDGSQSPPAAAVIRRPTEPAAIVVESELELLFRETYLRLYAKLRRYAEGFLSRDDAADAVCDTFAEVWFRWADLTPEQRNDRYFFRALRNFIYDAKRRQRERIALEDVAAELERRDAQAYADAPSSHERIGDVVDAVLAAMPPRRREALLLAKEQGYSYQEVADILGVSIGTVNTHLRLANADLRDAFKRAGFRTKELKAAGLQLLLPASSRDTDHV